MDKNKKGIILSLISFFVMIFLIISISLTAMLSSGSMDVCEEPEIDSESQIASTSGGAGISMDTNKKAFIEKLAKAAKSDEYNIMPSLTIAQGILESSWGTSFYAQDRNNLFGIGAYDNNPDNAFRFKSIEECVRFHDKILCAPPYGNGKATGIEGIYKWGPELKSGLKPYATDPSYFEKLNNLVNTYNLTKYDDPAMAGKITSTKSTATNIHTDSSDESASDECVPTSELSVNAVSLDINTKAKPYRSDGGNPFAPAYVGQCTWFAWGRFYEWYSIDSGAHGNGQDNVDEIVARHPSKFKKVTDFNELKDKSVFSCRGGGAAESMDCGHVGCVEKIDHKKRTMIVSEGNVMGKDHVVFEWSFEQFKQRYPNGLVFAVRK